jgi:hypothetical protein
MTIAGRAQHYLSSYHVFMFPTLYHRWLAIRFVEFLYTVSLTEKEVNYFPKRWKVAKLNTFGSIYSSVNVRRECQRKTRCREVRREGTREVTDGNKDVSHNMSLCLYVYIVTCHSHNISLCLYVYVVTCHSHNMSLCLCVYVVTCHSHNMSLCLYLYVVTCHSD